ncbi:sigma 54-interacting transcriptional regulator [Brevibacillus choshinensis]|uniref:sigma-54 interaction domain-containing protein n=1 Tax=Brevibacillus choshinensis TaxID=54911 RepID=UPI002E226D96|nr:sigma 54-interacting transcriptional regulator [Brevibacillus choshinensis]MED4583662.1 sigma 54-interacting transcriptional regulator [Brevibacillus choshinensis]
MIALYRLDKELERKIAALLDNSGHPIGYFYSIKSIIDQMMNPFVVITTEPYGEELESFSLPVVCLSIDMNDVKKTWDRMHKKEAVQEAVVVCGSQKETVWLEREYVLEPDVLGATCHFQLREDLQESLEHATYLMPIWGKHLLPEKPPIGEWHLIEPSLSTLRRTVQQADSLMAYTKDRLREKHLMEAVVNSAHDAVIAVDRHSQITLVNEHAKMLLGLTGEVLGKPITDYIPHSDMLRVLKTGRQELGDVATVLDRSIVINRIPVIVKDQIVGAVSNFKEISDIQKMEMSLRKKLHENGLEARYRLDSIIGSSPELVATKEQAAMFAKTNATVLITGESGTGKELFAQGIHLESTRAVGPFLAVNCAALPESLLESELFGYEDGAFTGAKKGGKPGLFELAHGGTLFLDEIGEMPLRIQVLLLRVLQERRVRRVGGERIIPVDVRIVAATNRDLAEEIERDHFRADLYYRINMLKLDVPPLRERLTDIPLLVEGMILELNEQHEQKVDQIDEEIYRLFQEYRWPGNVRELRNVVERMVLLSTGGRVSRENVDFLFAKKKGSVPHTLEVAKNGRFEPEAVKIVAALQQSKHNKTLAAKALGMDRTTLWRKMKQYDIE